MGVVVVLWLACTPAESSIAQLVDRSSSLHIEPSVNKCSDFLPLNIPQHVEYWEYGTSPIFLQINGHLMGDVVVTMSTTQYVYTRVGWSVVYFTMKSLTQAGVLCIIVKVYSQLIFSMCTCYVQTGAYLRNCWKTGPAVYVAVTCMCR